LAGLGGKGEDSVLDTAAILQKWHVLGVLLGVSPFGDDRFRDKKFLISSCLLPMNSGFTGAGVGNDGHEDADAAIDHIFNIPPPPPARSAVRHLL
jgi:hypothetical protein